MVWMKVPYTNFHNLNQDWIIRRMEEFEAYMKDIVNLSAIKYSDPIQWDITSQYEVNTVVLDRDLNAFLSTQPVPAGIALDNTNYWTAIGSFAAFFDEILEAIAYNNGNTMIMQQDLQADNLVFAGGVLYMLTADLTAGDAIREGSNAERYTVNNFIKHYVDKTQAAFRTEVDADIAAVNTAVTELHEYVDTQDDALRELIAASSIDAIINVKDFGATGDGITDDLPAFNAALVKAYTDGGVIWIPQGTYMLSDTWQIGNGSDTQESTYHDIMVVGAGCGNNHYISANRYYGRTVLRRRGSAQGPIIRINGPITGVQISNLQMDCNGVAASGLRVVHAAYSTFKNLSVIKHTNAAYISTTVAGNPVVYGAAGNRYDMIQCDDGSNGSQICMYFTGSLSSANTHALDTCRNVVERFEFNHGSDGKGVVLEFADNNAFIEGQIYCPAGTTGKSVFLNRPTAYPNFPSENVFINLAAIGGVGGQAGQANNYGSGGHWFIPYSRADGEPIPDLQNTHAILYNGQEYFGGSPVLKYAGYTAIPISSVQVPTTWTDIDSQTRSTGDTPVTLKVNINLSISGSVGIRVLVDDAEVAYRYIADGAYTALALMFDRYIGSGGHTIKVQAQTPSSGTIQQGTIEYMNIM